MPHPTPTNSTIFSELNKTRHIVNPGYNLSLFPELTQEDKIANNEYWLYSDLYNLFGAAYFPLIPNMDGNAWQNLVMPAPTKSKRAYPALTQPTYDFYKQHIVKFEHSYKLDRELKHNAKDLKLSRYGCWCMVRHFPELTFTQLYFTSPANNSAPTFQNLHTQTYQFQRLIYRPLIANLEKIIAGIIYKHRGDFRKVSNEMNQIFFGDIKTTDLKEIHNLPIRNGDPISNYMGAASLHARATGLQNAINKFNQLPKKNLSTFLSIATNELRAARIALIRSANLTPESDIFTTPVQAIQSQRAIQERNFIHEYANKKIR